jgi:formylmethanofuran dehydrogenase subunit E
MRLDDLLRQSAALHEHLCPRQVLGVRLALFGGKLLGLDLPRLDKRLLVVVETDGCAADGVAVASGCWVGKRTLRVEDFGKVAATFVDTSNGRAVRIAPHSQARNRAFAYAREATSRWEAQLLGYQRMPDDDLLTWQDVTLQEPVEKIVSQPGMRVICARCGEEVMNERQVVRDGVNVCRSCAGAAYYRPKLAAAPPSRLSRER